MMYVVHSIFSRILSELTELQGTLKFFVKWQGYDAVKDHTWEEEENLMYALGL